MRVEGNTFQLSLMPSRSSTSPQFSLIASYCAWSILVEASFLGRNGDGQKAMVTEEIIE
jgi:hypothetical protein